MRRNGRGQTSAGDKAERAMGPRDGPGSHPPSHESGDGSLFALSGK
eukprot:COSAG01_NODE_58812_length_303_cov_3.563725_1_plen_45_part_01